MAKKQDSTLSPERGNGIAPGSEHPCCGCLHYYGACFNNKCCNYIFDMGTRRPCEPGGKCTVKRPVTCKEDLKLRKAKHLH